MDPILDDLNEAQRRAVLHGQGPLMVLAGAGSGKTRVITRRIAHLLREGAAASEILALTFTNKAAGEMAGRVRALGGHWVHVATFHSACARFLRQDGERLGYPRDYSIYDTHDRDACIKTLLEELELQDRPVRPADVGRRISWLKNQRIGAAEFRSDSSDLDVVVGRVFGAYEARLQRLAAMDFDDLLLRFLDLLEQHPDVAEAYQERFPWILVDEFQDTNRVQYEMVKQLAGSRRNLAVVGDPDQSIYRFRGAEIRNMLDFERDFPATAVIRLETNYRSTKRILQAAEGVIEHNRERKAKRLRTDNDEGDALEYVQHGSAEDEAREIAARAHGLMRSGVSADEIAVFYRAHFVSRALEEALRHRGMPYQVVGGLSFFERREIKDLLAYLRVLLNPLDDISMGRIVNVPPRSIGKATLDKLRALAARGQMSLREAIGEPEVRAAFAGKVRRSLDRLAEILERLAARLASAAAGAAEVIEQVLEETDYVSYACSLGDPEGVSREENVLELVNDATVFDQRQGLGLSGYMQHVSLMTDQDRERSQGPAISLMTIHAAKGLEFDYVFLAGMEEGLFPHSRSVNSPADMEEERRLMYVALTRARRAVVLSGCRYRFVAGELRGQQASRFLGEIPGECLVCPQGAAWDPEDGDLAPSDRDAGDDSGDWDPGDSQLSDLPELAAGMTVVHPTYGAGVVLKIFGRGIQTRVRVRFAGGDERLLMLEYANLQVLANEGDR